jgi:short-subunit dehydrogenase
MKAGSERRGPRGKALVTGASRGIGRATAAVLVRQGFEVIGTSRDPAAIPDGERIEGVRYLPLDLTSEASIDGLLSAVGAVDVLINNAGASQIGPVEEVPADRVRQLFELNLFGPIRLIHGLLPGMRERRRGHIVSVASFAGVAPVPFSALYAASKAALIAVSRGLRHEVAPWGIRVTVVAPFDIRTGITQERYFGETSPYLAAVRAAKEHRDRSMQAAPEPRIVAERIAKILCTPRPKPFYPVGRSAALTALLVKHLPESFVDWYLGSHYLLG